MKKILNSKFLILLVISFFLCSLISENTCYAVVENSIRQVALGTNHTCGITIDNNLWCWGENTRGQLGVGDFVNRTSPTQVKVAKDESLTDKFFTDVLSISLGSSHTCAIKLDHTLWCWGLNYYGQLGLGNSGTGTNQYSPRQVKISEDEFLTDVSSVSLGEFHTCALKTDGTLWCWGRNYYGQLGLGNNDDKTYPTQVTGLTNISSINLGRRYSCVVKKDGTLWCWGQNEDYQLGIGNNTNQNLPKQVKASENENEFLTDVSSVSLGEVHTCVNKTDGTLWCWGFNAHGQLGIGSTTAQPFPTQVKVSENDDKYFTDVSSISLGYFHTCAKKTDYTLWCWGFNGSGQLGIGSNINKLFPEQVVSLTNVSRINTGAEHTCAIELDGTLWCWGRNDKNQVGVEIEDVSTITSPIKIYEGAGSPLECFESELFPLINLPCTSGHGICQGEGTYYCDGNLSSSSVLCSGVEDPSKAVPELCNGLNDNCDVEDLIDEDYGVGDECQSATGVGVYECLDESDVYCDIIATFTPTVEYTPTTTNTLTETATITNTITETPTVTNIFTETITSTNTLIITNTFTETPTVTNTFTETPAITNTFTETPAITNTFTETPIATNTLINTATNTPINTNTFTKTLTQTPTFTPTSTKERMDNPITLKGKTIKASALILAKKKVTRAFAKAVKITKAKGTLSYQKIRGNKKITIDSVTGIITIKKGLKKGTYKIKVDVTASGNDLYKPATKRVTFTLNVR